MAGPYVEAPNFKMTGSSYTARLFHKYQDKVNLMAEYLYVDTSTDVRQRETMLTLGGKYRVNQFLKLGAYYQRASGLWHEDDWLPLGGGLWAWKQTADRDEDIAILEMSPRMRLAWLPGSTWVFEQRFRYFYNFFNDQHHLRARSNLTYFWLGASKPFINFNVAYELYLPFNYGRRTIYETWLYLGALYHINKTFKVGLNYSIRKQYWQATDRFRGATNLDFRSVDTAKLWGLSLVVKI